MKVTRFFQKLQAKRRAHHSGNVKFRLLGEQITDADYEVTEWELKTHQRLSAQSELQRYTR